MNNDAAFVSLRQPTPTTLVVAVVVVVMVAAVMVVVLGIIVAQTLYSISQKLAIEHHRRQRFYASI